MNLLVGHCSETFPAGTSGDGLGSHAPHRVAQHDHIRVGGDDLLQAELGIGIGDACSRGEVGTACTRDQQVAECSGAIGVGLGRIGRIDLVKDDRLVRGGLNFFIHGGDASLKRIDQAGDVLSRELADDRKVIVHFFNRLRVLEIINGQAKVFELLYQLRRIDLSSQDKIRLQGNNRFGGVFAHRAAYALNGLCFLRIIGEFIAAHHLGAGTDGKQNFRVGRGQGNDTLGRTVQCDLAAQAVGHGQGIRGCRLRRSLGSRGFGDRCFCRNSSSRRGGLRRAGSQQADQ